MGDVLDISNVDDLIGNLNGEGAGGQESCSHKFSNQIREMFPDVDPTFLSYECRNLHTEEDCARFINSVMLIDLYPKKSRVWNDRRSTTSFPQDNEIQFLDYFHFKPEFYSTDEESDDSEVMQSGYCKVKRKKSRVSDSFPVGTGLSMSTTSVDDIVEEPSTNNLIELKEIQGGDESSIAAVDGTLEADDHCLISDSKREDGREKTIQSIDYSDPGSSSLEYYPKVGVNYDVGHGDYSSMRSTNCETLSSPGGEAMQEDALPASSEAASHVKDLESTDTSSNVPESSDGAREEDLTVTDEWLEEQTAELIRLFPNTDPTFLRDECAKFQGSLEAMNEFVISKLEKNDMPSRADYEKRQEMKQLQNTYTKNFSIEEFLKVIPDPWTYFANSHRNCARYKAHSLIFLENSFRNIHSREITTVMMKNDFNLYLSYKELEEKKPSGGMDESYVWQSNLASPTNIYIQFLQEVAFIQNEGKIRDFIKARDVARHLRLEEAKRDGRILLECKCCYDPEIMVEDIVYCPNDHPFCKPCVAKYVEMEMAEARYDFACLAGCKETFTLFTLQNVVKGEVFSKIVQAKQMEEIEAAGIEGLVQCPFCSYAAIMPPEDKVLSCLNIDCQKKTCRLCKEPCHIPLRCDEVEKSEEVKIRTYIENRMTQALIRTCYKCGKGFVKEDGCNKIVCKCGAKMCYVCRKPITSYSHFSSSKGIDRKKCPLYSTNDELHLELVKRAAQEAKAEILANPNRTLKRNTTAIPSDRSKNSSQRMRWRTGTIASVR